MKIEQEIMEMFDKECKQVEFLHGVPVDLPHYYKEELKSFISHIITLVQQNEREEVVERIREYAEPYEGSKWLNEVNAEKIINLIKQND